MFGEAAFVGLEHADDQVDHGGAAQVTVLPETAAGMRA
jgi:hypothetical protein